MSQVHLTEEDDAINPNHYKRLGKYSPIDVALAWEANPCVTHALKYLGRAGYKDPDKHVEDLNKAIWFIQKNIKVIMESKYLQNVDALRDEVRSMEKGRVW